MHIKRSMVALAVMSLAASAHADSFVNGGFESGDLTGWTIGGGSRTPVFNNQANFTPANFLSGGLYYNATIANSHSAVIGTSYVDPNVPAALLGSTVYNGNYALRVEDTITGGYASVATQTVTNYTDSSIFFAWKALLEGAHGATDAATLLITLKDLTTGTTLITRQYNAASGGGGVDARFSYYSGTGFYYTSAWQIEQLSIDSTLAGHDFQLSVLAADCQQTGHAGYVYLDGFGAVLPEPVPEPATLGLAGAALMAAAAARRRARRQRV